MLKRALVIGASSGIGEALAGDLVGAGYKVACVARREEKLNSVVEAINRRVGEQRAWSFVADVVDTDAAPSVFRDVCTTLDGLDLVVFCAGVMPAVDEDTWDAAIDRQIFEVNVVGASNWLNLAAERFQAQKSGVIVGIGSVAGDRGRRLQPAYCASKAALHTYLESLRNRLSRHGVHVLTVKPGPVHTPLTAGLDKLPMAISAEQAANSIVNAVARRSDVAYVPIQWWPIMTVIRAIPSVIFRRMSI